MPDNCVFDISPLAQSNITDTPRLSNLDYTCQDFWSLKDRIINNIKESFGDVFNDFIESDLAIMLLENWAFIGDLLSFKIDHTSNEIFIDSVTEIGNAFRISKFIGFRPQPPIAARSKWIATLGSTIEADVVIPAGLQVQVVSQQTPIVIELYPADSNFEPILDQDIVIKAGSLQNSSIIGLEGSTSTDSFAGTGELGQTVEISVFPIIWDSISVKINGTKWEEVEYFTDSQRRLEYRVEYDSSYKAFVIFGNNRAGMIPPKNSEILVTYRKGGGTVGNIVTGSVTTQRTVSVPGFDFGVPVSIRNYTKGEYGYDGDTIEDIRRKLPSYIKTQNRAVSGSDYKTLVDQFVTPYHGMIGKSNVVLRNYGCSANIVDIYVLAKDGQEGLTKASNELKVQLEKSLQDKKMLTDFICIRDGFVILADIFVDVITDKFYRKFEDEIREYIKTRVNKYFSLNNWEYGKILKESDLVKTLSDIKNIKSFEVSFVTGDSSNRLNIISPRFFEIVRADDLTINFIYE